MSRPKPNRAEPVFYLRGHELSDSAKSRLIELLGYGKVDLLEESVRRQHPGMKVREKKPGAPLILERDPDPQRPSPDRDLGKVILAVELALGIYIDGKPHLDDKPRPADYVATFKPIQREARKLLDKLCSMGVYFRDRFELKRAERDSDSANIYQVEKALGSLAVVSYAILEDFEKRPSKGRAQNTALLATILQLRSIFQDNYHGPRTGRRQRGAFQFISDYETRELEFVEAALLDAGIPYRDLRRLFRNARCIPQKATRPV